MSHGPPARRAKINNDAAGHDGDEDDDEMPPPPDGGWGWVVVFGSFMIHVITDGMTYSFGLFYNEFVEEFQESRAKTAWIISMLTGVTLCSGPISALIVNCFGCRKATIVGVLMAGCFMLASAYAQNVLTLIFTIGIGTGLGLGMMYVPAIVSVTMYFDNKRSFATGIAVCGSGVGTFIFAPLTEFLITKYQWRVALMIVAVCVLSCVMYGALFRPLQPLDKKRRALANEEGLDLEAVGADREMYNLSTTSQPENGNANNGSTQRRSSLHKPITINASKNSVNDGTMVRSYSVGHSLVKGGANNGQRSNANRVHYDDNHNGPNGHVVAATETDSINGSNNDADKSKTNTGDPNETLRSALSQPFLNEHHLQFKSSHRSIAKSGTMSRPDILYQGSLHNIANYRSTHDLNGGGGAFGGRTDSYGSFRRIARDERRSIDVVQEKAELADAENDVETAASQSWWSLISKMMNFDLFDDPIFIVFTVSNFCTSVGFNIPYVYLAAHAQMLGISGQDSSYLLALIGIANTVGRIVLGYVSDKPWVNRLVVYNLCLTSCGIATFLSMFCQNFLSLAVFAVFFGFTIGAYVGLTSVILVDLLGLEKLTNAFGLLLLFQGIASLIGPPMAGKLYDLFLSYGPGFGLAGVTIAVSGFVLFAIPPMQRNLARRLTERELQQQQQAVGC